jgi:orotate phosphoribosyltransferase
MTFQTLKENYIDSLIKTQAFIVKSIDEEPFMLRSGKQSYMFLDHSKVASSAIAYKAFIEVIQYLLHETYGDNEFILCNIDSKISAQMVGSVAYNLSKPQIIYKSTALTEVEKGTQRQLTGDQNWNLPVALLDDVMTGGDGTAKNVGDLVGESFSKVTDIQIFVGFVRTVKESKYKTHYVLTRDELLATIWEQLAPKQQQAVNQERSN